MTERLGWSQPEHTLEFTADEIIELLGLAGFAVTRLIGLWDCHGQSSLEPESIIETQERAGLLGADRIDDAFVWWVEAERVGAADVEALRTRIGQIFDQAWPERMLRRVVESTAQEHGVEAGLRLLPGVSGVLTHGPHAPLTAGRYTVIFDVETSGAAQAVVGHCLVHAGHDWLGKVALVATGSSQRRQVEISFDLDEMTFGLHARLDVTGVGMVTEMAPAVFLPERPHGV